MNRSGSHRGNHCPRRSRKSSSNRRSAWLRASSTLFGSRRGSSQGSHAGTVATSDTASPTSHVARRRHQMRPTSRADVAIGPFRSARVYRPLAPVDAVESAGAGPLHQPRSGRQPAAGGLRAERGGRPRLLRRSPLKGAAPPAQRPRRWGRGEPASAGLAGVAGGLQPPALAAVSTSSRSVVKRLQRVGRWGALVKTLLTLVLLAAAVVAVAKEWLRPDILWSDVADAPNHLVRIYVIDAALSRGEWYPRWLSDLYLGYGYPLLNYYAPSTYYLASLLHRWGMTIYASFQWTAVLGVALGATGAAALVFAMTNRRDAAAVAGTAFVLAPYPFLTNLYVRAAVPEALALGLIPWLLLALWASWQSSRSGVWSSVVALCVAGLLLTHNISALMGMAVLALWLPVVAAVSAAPPLPALRRTLASLAAGLGLSAFFWVPALAETSLVQIRLAQADFFDVGHWLFDPLHAAGKLAEAGYPHTRVGPVDLAPVFNYGALPIGAPEKISLWQLLLWLF